jgi:hypothetical protein
MLRKADSAKVYEEISVHLATTWSPCQAEESWFEGLVRLSHEMAQGESRHTLMTNFSRALSSPGIKSKLCRKILTSWIRKEAKLKKRKGRKVWNSIGSRTRLLMKPRTTCAPGTCFGTQQASLLLE